MEPACLLPYSQGQATCLGAKPDQSSLCLTISLLEDLF